MWSCEHSVFAVKMYVVTHLSWRILGPSWLILGRPRMNHDANESRVVVTHWLSLGRPRMSHDENSHTSSWLIHRDLFWGVKICVVTHSHRGATEWVTNESQMSHEWVTNESRRMRHDTHFHSKNREAQYDSFASWLMLSRYSFVTHLRRDSFWGVTWRIKMRAMSYSHMRHDVFKCITWLTRACVFVRLYLRHDAFRCMYFRICVMTYSYVRHYPFVTHSLACKK